MEAESVSDYWRSGDNAPPSFSQPGTLSTLFSNREKLFPPDPIVLSTQKQYYYKGEKNIFISIPL